ncbi:SpoIIE family protein phosphatase [Microscilla marina]|uniref:Serine/threonine kinase with GAF domain, putative n=1 Tax=Microscilla marina ATCC 23134 TaxID=313606 RepID=A1ZSD7_MICM2|nr:SpoIIE family protein phosphatase [Microscilla marina]EAY26685.1 serine/threonine kinase with GAF domain, putative [Microscilla marina ATCC 23134]
MLKYIGLIISICFWWGGASVQAQKRVQKVKAFTVEEKQKLQGEWLYHKGDNPVWAKPGYDDKNWQNLDPRLWLKRIKKGTFEGIGWFRIHLDIEESLRGKTVALLMHQRGASEVYLNGKLVHKYGVVSINTDTEVKYNPFGEPVKMRLGTQARQVLAVRYSSSNALRLHRNLNRWARTAGFHLYIAPLDQSIKDVIDARVFDALISIGRSGILFALGLLHLFIFIFYPVQRANLYYALATLDFAFTFYISYLHQHTHSVDNIIWLNITSYLLSITIPLFFLKFLYTLFNNKVPRHSFMFLVFALVNAAVMFFAWSATVLWVYQLICGIEALRVTIVAIRRKKKGAKIIFAGVVGLIIFTPLGTLAFLFPAIGQLISSNIIALMVNFGILSVTGTVSIYLARDIAKTSVNLRNQLDVVQELSAKNIAQEREKQEILEQQKEKLEQLVQARTSELEEQATLVKEQNAELTNINEEIAAQRDVLQGRTEELVVAYKHITDSVQYAQRIQNAILGNPEQIISNFDEAFIFLKPKDIVSGDFYWYTTTRKRTAAMINDDQSIIPAAVSLSTIKILIAADCTGHGVPGAFMTVMGNSLLDDIINSSHTTMPDQILKELDRRIIKSLSTKGEAKVGGRAGQVNDGMDMSVIMLDETQNKLYFAGAKNPLYFIRNGVLENIKGSVYPIGSEQYNKEKSFELHTIDTQKGDVFYMFSDGFQDQFGGPEGRKYMRKNFRNFLLSISHLPMTEQQEKVTQEFDQWCNKQSQTDDVLLMGFKV